MSATSTPTTTTTPTPTTTFDPAAPLPRGTTVLEASAGTGKTWTMATIAMRCVAEGRAGIDAIMMVTFTRAATLDMRTRVRERLAGAEAWLDAVLGGAAPVADDPALAALAEGGSTAVRTRRDRLRTALSDFDRAMIATTHEFCGAMVSGLGVLADHSPADTLVHDADDLTTEVAADLFVRKYVGAREAPALTWDTARSLAHEAVGAVGALVPDPDDPAVAALTGVADRIRFAGAVRAEVARRKRARGWWSFEDMLERVLSALERPEAVRRLQHLFPVVLVDEFQDTDPVQWEVVRRAFVAGPTDLFLIGDPKQAIYGFRNAEVHHYLRAVEHADQRLTLTTNRRSDPALLRGLDALFTGAQLGDERIVARPVRGHHERERLRCEDPDRGPGVRLRVLAPDGSQRWASTLQDAITSDVVAEIRAHLGAAVLDDRPVVADDIAVIVGTHQRADQITAALRRAGIASVRPQADSVFASEAAEHWLALLEALDGLRERQVRRAALTWFVGWTLPDLAAADDTALSALSATLHRWSRAAEQNVAALLATMLREGLAERVLATEGGDRVLTDLRHVAQTLLAEQRRHGASLGGLHAWLAHRRGETRRGGGEWSRRLETESGAVSVMTVHHAKGLQFPVVLAPDLWRLSGWFPEDGVLRLHDAAEEPVLDVGGAAAPGRRERLAAARSQSAGESLRQAYVAATRAECTLVAWWASHRHLTADGALGRLLARDRTTGAVPDRCDHTAVPVGSEAIGVQPVTASGHRAPRARESAPVPRGPEALRARRLERAVDLDWRRTSYSGLTAGAHELGVGSEPPELVDDETVDVTTAVVDDAELVVAPGSGEGGDLSTIASPMAALPGGTAFGTIVHTVLEHADVEGPELRDEVAARCREVLARLPLPGLRADDLVDPLVNALRTPFGALAPGLDLASVRRADHLAELSFEYPLGRDRRGRWLTEVADLVAHHLPADDPLAAYPDLLRAPGLGDQSLRGFLTGSIDAVIRVDPGTDRVRHLVVDHKTNRLAPPGVDLTLAHYTSRTMAEAMMASHYPLQALLYCVALHRFLRWRQPGYDPERHLGGVLYLFVRGMAGPETPPNGGVADAAAPCGVFSWRPPAALVCALSDLLAALPDEAALPGEVERRTDGGR